MSVEPGAERDAVSAQPPAGDTVAIQINGEPHEFTPGATISDVVAAVADGPKGIAVARNAEVVPRSTWSVTVVLTGDRIEVLTAAQGG